MKKIVLILLLSAVVLAGCEGERTAEVPVETIKPATPPPTEADEDSVVITQTTEIGEERSPNEGGYVNQSGAPAATTTGGTPPPTATNPAQQE